MGGLALFQLPAKGDDKLDDVIDDVSSKEAIEPYADDKKYPFCRNGGLTLVPMPGYENLAKLVKKRFDETSQKFPTKVDIVLPKLGKRNSKEPFIRLGKEHIGGHDCVVITSGPGTHTMQGQLYMSLRQLAGRRARRICVISGYFPLGRSDKDEGLEEFAQPPLIVDLMLTASQNKLDRIIAVDLHAPQVVMAGKTGLITEVSLVSKLLKTVLDEAIKRSKKICLAFPDDTALKRAEHAIEELMKELKVDLPVVHGSKRRLSSKTSKLKDLYGDVQALKGALVITVDDEIATGGTNINAAERMKTVYKAKKVWAAVTHGVLCGKAPELFAAPDCPVDRVFITDTITTSKRTELQPLITSGKLTVVTWFKELMWIISRHHWDQDIRRLR